MKHHFPLITSMHILHFANLSLFLVKSYTWLQFFQCTRNMSFHRNVPAPLQQPLMPFQPFWMLYQIFISNIWPIGVPILHLPCYIYFAFLWWFSTRGTCGESLWGLINLDMHICNDSKNFEMVLIWLPLIIMLVWSHIGY